MSDLKNVQPLADFNWDEFENGSSANVSKQELEKAYDETLNKVSEQQVVEGKVISVNPKKGAVLVEGVNMVTKHTKPSMSNQQGGIVNKEAWIDASNVMVMHEGKATRVGFKVEDGKKVRVAKTTGKVID